MKNLINILCILTALLPAAAFGQVKIGGNPSTVNADAMLEIESADKGVLLPRVALTGTANAAPLSAHVSGMIVYNTATAGDVTPGYYFNNGSAWVRTGGAMSTFQVQEDGNAGATITDGQAVNFASGTNMNITRSGNTLTFNATGGGMTGFNIREDAGTQDLIQDGELITLQSGSNMNIVRTAANTFQFNATNTQLNQEQVQDFVGSMVSGNTETGITVTYDDAANQFDFVAADASATNEIQSLSLSGNTLSISGGNSVNLPSSNQTLSLSGSTLSISGGNSVNLSGLTGLTNYWSTTGNAAGGSNFIGTTNATALHFRTSNSQRLSILPDGNMEFGGAGNKSMIFKNGSYIELETPNQSTKRAIWPANNSLKLSFSPYVSSASEAEIVIFERSVHFNYEYGIKVPVGTTAQRGTVVGLIRFNSQTNKFEGLTNTGWVDLH